MRVRHAEASLPGWASRLQLVALRDALGAGLGAHAEGGNALLAEVVPGLAPGDIAAADAAHSGMDALARKARAADRAASSKQRKIDRAGGGGRAPDRLAYATAGADGDDDGGGYDE